ncbi:hypothetical protein SporoP37_02425 [Sporosarcina sp. P37]|uniref:phBC6A51 family helix-turn-helix protein n=1 Tax=unclassified Sporosarcina TaxID=2647733 RepID=UPI000A17FBAC|nr:MULTISPECIES: phBC6A51 family helix-turn-helix protein [unclassified Sporosarcina]ARK23657.1 hypothetical protein SporoP37_02425 [Sporosarcina sp. P37]PID18718.1 hypothetical protein CSV62_06325 [Sporosarcina sp. P35]
MNNENKAEALINAITVPSHLSDKAVSLAKQFVKSRMMDGFTIAEFCKSNGISTKTWYGFMEDEHFQDYLQQIQDAVIPTDEREAYEKIKKKIMQIADKQNPSVKEIELFTDTFAYVVEADKRERMDALGLTEEAVKASSFRTIEEKKASLLSRLKGD